MENQPVKSSDLTHCFAVPATRSIIDAVHPVTGRGLYSNETLEQVRVRYPGATVYTFEAWQLERGAEQDKPVEWIEVTKDKYDWSFECIFPAAMASDGFLLGEPTDHHAVSGKPRFSAYVHKAGKYYVSSRPVTVVEFKALKRPE